MFQSLCSQHLMICFCNCDFVKYLVSIKYHGKLLHDLFALFALTQFVPISGLHLLLCIFIIVFINARIFNTQLWNCHITFLYLLKAIVLIKERMYYLCLHCYIAFLYLLKTIRLINAVCFISGFSIVTLHFYTYLKQLV